MAKKTAKQVYEEDMKLWQGEVEEVKNENKRRERNYKEAMGHWTDDYDKCMNPMRKLLKILNKPKLEFLEIPKKPEFDLKKYEKQAEKDE